jgi:hypothetical protein
MKRTEPEGPLRTLGLERNARHGPTFPILVSIIGPAGLTAEFGMGSGVTPRVWAPGKKKNRGSASGSRERITAPRPLAPEGARDTRRVERCGVVRANSPPALAGTIARDDDSRGRLLSLREVVSAEPLSFVFPAVLSRAPPRKRKWSSQSAD